MRPDWNLCTALILLVSPSMAISQCNSVDPHSWLWWGNLATPTGSPSGWSTHPETYANIIATKLGTYVDTDLDVGLGPNGEGEVRFINGNYGIGAPDAWVRVWSSSLECTSVSGNNFWYDNTYCTGQLADRARITFNDYQMANQSFGLNTLIVLHEVGHVFGMQHLPSACVNTFMIPAPFVGQSEQLDSFEVNWINSNY